MLKVWNVKENTLLGCKEDLNYVSNGLIFFIETGLEKWLEGKGVSYLSE
jgi:hypothetical protein